MKSAIHCLIPSEIKMELERIRITDPNFNVSKIVSDYLSIYVSGALKKFANKNLEELEEKEKKQLDLIKKENQKLGLIQISIIKCKEKQKKHDKQSSLVAIARYKARKNRIRT